MKPKKRDYKRLLWLRKQPLCLEINKVYESIKDSKDFNVYYKSLYHLLKQFFVQEYLYTHKELPYPSFDEEMVEDFMMNWQRQSFSLRAREKKRKEYKTLVDKLSGDEVKRISYYLNLYDYRKSLSEFDKYSVSLSDNIEYIKSLKTNKNYKWVLSELSEYELQKIYKMKNIFFTENDLNLNIFIFISMFLSSFSIDYVSTNLYYDLSDKDFMINAFKCKFIDAKERIERRLDVESNEEVCKGITK